MTITKQQWTKIIAALLVFVISVLSTFGYDVLIDQPREQAQIEAVYQTIP